jgi:tight adherence protein B
MKVLILLFFFITSTFLFASVFQMIFLREKRLEKRIEKYLAVTDKEVNRKQLNMMVQFQLAKRKYEQNF